MTRAEREAAAWNASVPIGAEIEYRMVPGAPPMRYTTRCEAYVMGGHTAVVMLNDKRGCVAINACRAVEVES